MANVDENGFSEIAPDLGAPEPIIPSRSGPGGWRLPEQNLGLALIVGALTGLVGSALWAGISVLSERRVGYLALAIGFVVGWAVRKAGRGTTWPFGAVAALCTLLSCALGMVLAYGLKLALADGAELGLDTLGRLLGFLLTEPLLASLRAALNPVDGVFTLIAAYQALQLGYARPASEAPEALP